jgi:hypothetical protein
MKHQTPNTKHQTPNTKHLLLLSLIVNIIFIIGFCFIAYYKRNSIINYAVKFYEKIFLEKQIEQVGIDYKEFIQEKYESEIHYINNNYNKNIKIAILGNSLTLIPSWNGGAGLTASDKEHDYVHILLNKISNKKEVNIEYLILNIADFERGFEEFDYTRLEVVQSFKADIVIFQIGENIVTELLNSKGEIFLKKYIDLINYCDGEETIVCLPFWPVKEKIQIITEVAIGSEAYLVDLSHIGSGIDPLNFAKSERKYDNHGVGVHPGDYGMNNIAKVLYLTVNKIIE